MTLEIDGRSGMKSNKLFSNSNATSSSSSSSKNNSSGSNSNDNSNSNDSSRSRSSVSSYSSKAGDPGNEASNVYFVASPFYSTTSVGERYFDPLLSRVQRGSGQIKVGWCEREVLCTVCANNNKVVDTFIVVGWRTEVK